MAQKVKSNVLNILSNINSSSSQLENNSKTKYKPGNGQMHMDVNNMHLAPTTVDSKEILQHHPHLQHLLSMGSEHPTNLGLMTPNIDSSTIKTLNTTNNIRDIINQ